MGGESVSPSHDGVTQSHQQPSTQHRDVGTSNDEKKMDATPGEKLEKSPVTVCTLRSVSKFTIPVQVQGRTVEAVLDSAAEVTIISDRVYASLKAPPEKLYDVRLDTAGRQMSMRGFVAGPVKLKIGRSYYDGPLYVAPIEQDMLFGVDIMRKGAAAIDMGKNVFRFKGQEIRMNTDVKEGSNPVCARVAVAKRVVIPPNSVAQVPCKMDRSMSDYVIEPTQTEKALAPRVVRSAGTEPVVCILNCSDRYKLLQKGKEVAIASPVDEYIPEKDDNTDGDVEVCDVSKSEDKTENVVPEVPGHLQESFESSKEHLSVEEQCRLAELLIEHEDVFAKDEFDLGTFTEIQHGIQTDQAAPIKQRLRRTPACFVDEEEAHLKKMLDAGVIQPSSSDWASSPVLIRKRDGSVRWCIDYRQLNNVTVKDVFPLPLVDDCLDTLAGSIWFSKLDANSAYWQINIKPEDRHKTAFHTRYGLFEHVKMGFGLCHAPATYARVMNLVMRGLHWKTVLAFLDDVLILGRTFDDHLSNLGDALKRFRRYGLKLKPKKCVFFQKEVEFLGRIVSGDKLSMTQIDIEAVSSWPIPTCSKDVERFMGLANYHRSFVKNFSKLAEPLYSVVGKHKFRWKEEQSAAFHALKEALTNPPVLALPNKDDSFVLDTDASNEAIGAELIQLQNGEEKVIAYGSYALTKEQRRYCTTRKELLAVVRFCRQYKYYLMGKPFTIRTDHSSLTWLLRFKEPQGQLARWLEELQQYNMTLKHRAGRKHANADALSRMPRGDVSCDQYQLGVRPRDLPCGGCRYCVRADSQWGTFTREVDDAIPLTLLNSTGIGNIVHDVEVPTTDESSGESRGPLVGDTGLDRRENSVEQLYQGISAETVGVRKNDQIRQSGKTGSRDGAAFHEDRECRDEILAATEPTGARRLDSFFFFFFFFLHFHPFGDPYDMFMQLFYL